MLRRSIQCALVGIAETRNGEREEGTIPIGDGKGVTEKGNEKRDFSHSFEMTEKAKARGKTQAMFLSCTHFGNRAIIGGWGASPGHEGDCPQDAEALH